MKQAPVLAMLAGGLMLLAGCAQHPSVEAMSAPAVAQAGNAASTLQRPSHEQIQALIINPATRALGLELWRQETGLPPVNCIDQNAYGAISCETGLPKTQHVNGYLRSNGTYVGPYYRSP